MMNWFEIRLAAIAFRSALVVSGLFLAAFDWAHAETADSDKKLVIFETKDEIVSFVDSQEIKLRSLSSGTNYILQVKDKFGMFLAEENDHGKLMRVAVVNVRSEAALASDPKKTEAYLFMYHEDEEEASIVFVIAQMTEEGKTRTIFLNPATDERFDVISRLPIANITSN